MILVTLWVGVLATVKMLPQLSHVFKHRSVPVSLLQQEHICFVEIPLTHSPDSSSWLHGKVRGEPLGSLVVFVGSWLYSAQGKLGE